MTNSSANHWYNDIGHTVTRLICQGIYFMMGSVYDIICQIANSPIISSESILKFYNRVQLIIGVFMMFRLAVTIIQGIIDPDKFTDAKAGIGNVITKIITALAILTLIIPLQNIPDNVKLNSLENRMKNDGILFGAMYELQSRLIADDGSGNVLIKLVIGPSEDVSRVRSAGQNLATIVLKSFFTPNLIEGSDNKDFINHDTGKYKHNYLYCSVYDGQKNKDGEEITDFSYADEVKDAYDKYYKESTTTTDILNMINQGCDSEYDSESGYDSYAFNFNWFAGLIVGLLFLFMLVMLCIEVAKRAIKLAILRLISPIPIISYMSPGSTFENGPMGAWVKTTTKTYIELFINLLVIYFAFFVIKEIEANNGLIFSDTISGSAGIFAKIFIYIGLILFAKDAPKFIKQALGVKDEGGFFSGIKGTMAGLGAMAGTAAGLGAAGIGAIGSGIASGRASYMSDTANSKKHNLLRVGKNVGAGLLGGISGFGAGAKASIKSKDHAFKNSVDAMQKRNATAIAAGDAGSTAIGRTTAKMSRFFTGDTAASRADRNIEALKARKAALEAVKSRASSEMVKQDWTKGSLGINRDIHGKKIGDVNYKSFMASLETARAQGKQTVSFVDADGHGREISLKDAELQYGYLLKNNEDSYIKAALADKSLDTEFTSLVADADAKGGSVSDRKSVTTGAEALADEIRVAERKNVKAKQNDRFSSK